MPIFALSPTLPEPEPTPESSALAAYMHFYPICTPYVRLLLRNSEKRSATGVDTTQWPR